MNSCPRDQQILASNDVSGYRYYSCETCHGFWIPGATLHRVLTARGIPALRAAPRSGPSDTRCPDCLVDGESLLIDGCKLDQCPKCRGVWLDSGEARRVRQLFPEGSAVVLADERLPSKETQHALVGCSLVDAVGNVLLLILPG